MVQEDLAISPCGLYESYFLLLILVVNFVKLQQKIYIYQHDSVTSAGKWLTIRGIPSTIQISDITATRKKDKKMRDEKGKVMKKN